MTRAIFFDVDDTLYNQVEPFYKAYIKNFEHYNIDVNYLFKTSREISDELFEKSQSGDISMKEMQIMRIQFAFEKLNIKISREEAWKFQQDYEKFQDNITLSDTLKNMFDYLKGKDIIIGIITNGPSSHQRKKIRNLELHSWIEDNNIFISSEVGFSKPDRRIFSNALSSVGGDKISEVFYVGDSFENDICGASQVGWKSIWMNRRKKSPTNMNVKSKFEVHTEIELYNIITSVF